MNIDIYTYYIHTYILTYIHTYRQTDMCTYIRTYIHTLTYIHTYIYSQNLRTRTSHTPLYMHIMRLCVRAYVCFLFTHVCRGAKSCAQESWSLHGQTTMWLSVQRNASERLLSLLFSSNTMSAVACQALPTKLCCCAEDLECRRQLGSSCLSAFYHQADPT